MLHLNKYKIQLFCKPFFFLHQNMLKMTLVLIEICNNCILVVLGQKPDNFISFKEPAAGLSGQLWERQAYGMMLFDTTIQSPNFCWNSSICVWNMFILFVIIDNHVTDNLSPQSSKTEIHRMLFCQCCLHDCFLTELMAFCPFVDRF